MRLAFKLFYWFFSYPPLRNKLGDFSSTNFFRVRVHKMHHTNSHDRSSNTLKVSQLTWLGPFTSWSREHGVSWCTMGSHKWERPPSDATVHFMFQLRPVRTCPCPWPCSSTRSSNPPSSNLIFNLQIITLTPPN